MLFAAETAAAATEQYIGLGVIGAILLVLNQLFNILQKNREQKAALAAAELLAGTQAQRDQVAIRKEELALCTAEDDHAIAGYEKLLVRYNTRLVEVEAEVKELRKELTHCQQEHARSEERVKHLEQRCAEFDRKYNALKKKIPGIDSDTVLMPEDVK